MDAALDITKTGEPRRYRRLSFTSNFIMYWVIFAGALIFTQALRSKASNIFFGFVFFLPWVMLIYVNTARSAVSVEMLSSGGTISKHEPFEYSFRIINRSIIPYPFMDAVMTLPQHNSVRCTDRIVRLALSPISSYVVKNQVNFRFRGTYEIGVNCIYVYDFFRIMRLRLDIGEKNEVAVLPRKLVLREGEVNAIADSVRETKKDPHSYEKIEISDIRDYRSGDPLKSIHWKLSSKSEDFLVRDYDTGSSKRTYIYCDLSMHYPDTPPDDESDSDAKRNIRKKKSKDISQKKNGSENDGNAADASDAQTAKDAGIDENTSGTEVKDNKQNSSENAKRRKNGKNGKNGKNNNAEGGTADDFAKGFTEEIEKLAETSYYDDMNEFCADGVVELSVAAVLRELRDGNECVLLWFDRRSDAGFFCVTLRGLEDFNTVYRLFATAPLCSSEDSVDKLAQMISDSQDIKQLYITSAIDPEAIKRFCALPSASDGSAASEVILFNPEERFAHRSERRIYIESCRAQLRSHGFWLSENRID